MKQKLKALIATSLLTASSYVHAGFVGYGGHTGLAGYGGKMSQSQHESTTQITNQEFDYIITCKAIYEEIQKNQYKYYCSNPPNSSQVVFMGVVYEFEKIAKGYPKLIIYYMKNR